MCKQEIRPEHLRAAILGFWRSTQPEVAEDVKEYLGCLSSRTLWLIYNDVLTKNQDNGSESQK